MTLIWPFNAKVKCHEVNWKTIYDLLYHAQYDAPFRRYNLLKVMWPWFDLEKLSKVKWLQVNWYFIKDFLYVSLINYGQNVRGLWNIPSWKPNDLWFALSISSKVKCYKVNWKVIYDLLYVFHTHFDHVMHHLWETIPWKICDLDLTFKGNPMSKVTRSTERSYMTLYMCFIQTLVTACTVSEILA